MGAGTPGGQAHGHGHVAHGHGHDHGADDHGAHDHGAHDHGAHRTHRFSPAHVDRLLSPERAHAMPPEPTLRAAGVEAGATVLDLGCGPGFLTLPARAIVGPSGRVIAADVEPEMLDHLRGRLAAAGIADVAVVQAAEGRVPLEDHVADVVLAAFVLHEADDPAGFLAECARLATPHGVVSVLEWRHEGDHGPPVAHRIAVSTITALAAGAGLVQHEVVDLGPDRVLVRLTRAG